MNFHIQRELASISRLNLKDNSIEYISMKLGHIIQPFLVHLIGAEFETLYRARINKFPDKFYTKLSELWYPSPEYVIKLGRFNKIKESMFYASVHELGALFECQPKHGDVITIVTCKKKSSNKLKVANLFLDDISKDPQFKVEVKSIKNNAAAQSLLKNNREKKDHALIQSFLEKEALREVKPSQEYKYKLSIAIRDIFFAVTELDGLFYPSLALDKQNINFVLLPSAADFHYIANEVTVLKYNKITNMAECIAKSSAINPTTGEISY